MDVFRIESIADKWVLYKAHGYKPIMHSNTQADLIEHVCLLTGGKGAVIRFSAEFGVRELRVGIFGEDEDSKTKLGHR